MFVTSRPTWASGLPLHLPVACEYPATNYHKVPAHGRPLLDQVPTPTGSTQHVMYGRYVHGPWADLFIAQPLLSAYPPIQVHTLSTYIL